MMRKITFLWLSLLFFLSISDKIYAQDNCGGAIANAKALYEQGKLRDVISGLKPCLNNSLSRSELWQGYELMALSYLALNDLENARKATEDMLDINPQPNLSPLKYPKDFIDLVNSVVVIPKFSLGFSANAGINYTFVNVIGAPYLISNYTKTYTSKPGYQIGLFSGYAINRYIDIDLGLYGSYKNYSISYATNGFNVNVNEKLTYLEVPLAVKYTFGSSKLRPYLEVGGYEGFLLSAYSDFNSTYTASNPSQKLSDNNVSSSDRLVNTNFGLLGGIGLTYKVGPGHFLINLKYCYGLTNIVKGGTNRYADENIYFKYYYLDDDISLNNLLLSVGYVYYVNYKVIRHKNEHNG